MSGSDKKWHDQFLKAFFHDPIDKPFSIPGHESRAEEYAGIFDVSQLKDATGSDVIASCMERSLVDQDIRQPFNEVRHPLSGGFVKVEDEATIEWNKEEFKRIFEQIKGEIGLDNEKKAFFLWRNLLEKLLDGLKEKPTLKKYLPILPADTRVPDHSIWEHLKIATATNASFIDDKLFQNNSLFLFTIGPVQSFIAQARKTQDAYMGSFILSYLTFVGIKEVVEQFGPTSIVYPDLFKQPLMDWYLEKIKNLTIADSQSKFVELPTIPNRFVAIIGITDSGEIKGLADRVKKAIKAEVEKAAETIAKSIGLNNSGDIELFKSKLFDFPQMFWVALPWRKGNFDICIGDLKDFHEGQTIENWQGFWDWIQNTSQQQQQPKLFPPNIGLLYPILYTTLEKFMGARKNVREFEQLGDNEEIGRKCSVCGERAVMFYRERNSNEPLFIKDNLEFFYGNKSKAGFVKLSKEEVTLSRLAVGEGLCALCFLKRNLDIYLSGGVDALFKDNTFPSTAEVASSSFKKKAYEIARDKFEEYQNAFESFIKTSLRVKPLPKLRAALNIRDTLEGYWLLEENLTNEKLEEEGFSLAEDKIEELKKKLKNICEAVGEKPCSYYALINLDGDELGKWLSGEKLPKIENAYNSETWQNLPQGFKDELTNLKVSGGKKLLSPAIHASISAALRNYAIEFVRKIVEEEHLGKLIYAGGDDLLAFVNLEDLLDVMEKLRWAFSGQIVVGDREIKPALNEKTGFVLKDGVYLLTMGSGASCSMGVVIAHYKEPLRYVFGKAKQMNKKAKGNGRDSFAIALVRRSGEERECVAKWMIENSSTIAELKFIKERMDDTRSPYISDGFIKKFQAEFARLIGQESELREAILNSSLKRLIGRSYNGDDKQKEGFVSEFYKKVEALLWRTGGNIGNFIALVEILSFLNKPGKEVG